MDYSPPGSSIHGDSPGRNTGVVAMPSFRGSSQPRSPTLQVDSLPSEPPGESMNTGMGSLSLLQGDLSNQEIESRSPALQADSLPAELPGKPYIYLYLSIYLLANMFVQMFP